MKTINKAQEALIKKYLKREFNQFEATDEEIELFSDIIDKAEELERELDAYDEVGDDLVAWFYSKCQVVD